MKENRDQVLQWLGLSEGGYVNHPDDPGGATMYGVTQRVYTAWRRSRGENGAKSVRHISKEEADHIFVDQYFAPVWFDRLPSGLDYAMADYSVNSGPSQAVKDLQRVLVDLEHNVAVDGHMGLVTLAAVRATHAGLLVSSLCNRRLAFMKRLRHWNTFKNGWKRRVMGEEYGQQDWDSGVIDRGVRMALRQPQRTSPRHSEGKAVQGDKSPGLFSIIVGFIAALFGGKK